MCSTTPRIAHTVDDLWDRLSAVRTLLTSRRQTDLSKRDVEFLLEYREKMESSREEHARCTGELDYIRRILQAMNRGDGSLQDLAQLPQPTTELATKIFYNFILLRVFKSAVKDGSDKISNFSKIALPKDMRSLPAFYQIVKDGMKKKDHAFDKDIDRAAKLYLWVKTQSDKPKKKKAPSVEKKDNHRSIPCTPSSGAPVATPTTPKVTKAPQHSSTNGGSTNLTYQCHLLLGRHPASSAITSAEYKKLSTLEEKLKYLLDELHAVKTNVKESSAESKSSPTATPSNISVGLQVEMDPKTDKKEICPESEVKEDVQTKLERSASLTDDDVFLSNSQTREDFCVTCRRQYSKPLEVASSLSSTILSGKLKVDRQTSASSQLGERGDDMLGQETSLPPLTGDLKDLQAVNQLYSEILQEKNSTSSQRENLTSSHDKVLVMRRRQSAPIINSTCASIQEERIIALEPSQCPAVSYKETQSRAVSARLYSPEKKRTVRLKNADTQTEILVDPQEASPEVLFADDEAEGPRQISFANYGRPASRPSGMNGHTTGRSVMSPDGKAAIIWTVSNNLKPGQWTDLFTLLMEKSDEMVVPQEIKEDIKTIMKEHQGDKMQAVACLEKWTQVSGRFETRHLLEALEKMRRKDIVIIVVRHLNRLNHMSL